MKRFVVILAVLSILFLLVPAYSVASAKSPKPQDQVRNFMSAAAGLKASKAASYCVTEESSNVASQLAKIPSGTKISLSGLKLVVANQTADTAQVTSTYTLKVQLKGQKKAQQTKLSDTFNLKLVDGIWLISDTSMWDHLGKLLITSIPKATTTATSTAIPTATPTFISTPVSTPTGTIKLGLICTWSGPMAMSGQFADQTLTVIQQQVKAMGGLLGGRDVVFVRGDDRGLVSDAVAQATKLVLDDKVDMLLFGGSGGAQNNAVAKEAERLKIPYVAVSEIFGSATMKYSTAIYTSAASIGRIAGFPIEYMKPKTIAFLELDDSSVRGAMDGVDNVAGARERIKNAGIDIVYEQYYPFGTTDYSPYLTTIKYKKPDLVVIGVGGVSEAITINKQIMELGGWGDIKVFHCYSGSTHPKVDALPAALGNYTAVDFMAGSDEPGMKTFEAAFVDKTGKSPTPELTYYYNVIWTGMKAIEMAGTIDHDKVAEALRSGNLEWDSAWGYLRMHSDGKGVTALSVAQVQEGGKLVKVWSCNPE